MNNTYRSPAATILAQHLGPAATVSTVPGDAGAAAGPAGATYTEPIVIVGWTGPANGVSPGNTASPVCVCPVPSTESGEYVVSYRQAAVVSTLLDLPATVEGLMTMVREGRYRPARRA